MERNVMGELNMHRAAGTKPNFSDIARRHGLDRHTVAKYWKGGGEVEDRRSDRESAFERVRAVVEAKAVLPGATKKGVHEMLLHKHNDPPLPGYGAFTAWCRGESIAFGAAAPEARQTGNAELKIKFSLVLFEGEKGAAEGECKGK